MDPLVFSIRFAIVIAVISIISMILARNNPMGLLLSGIALGISVLLAVLGFVIVKKREDKR